MAEVIGQILPLALGIAISPIPIIAVILMLLSPRAGGTSAGFLLGWLVGIVAATVVFVVIAEVTGLQADDDPSAAASWIKIALGVVLLGLAVRLWRGRPKPGETAALPGWMTAIDSLSPVKAAGLGVLLAAVNPKNLTMAVGSGIAIGGAELSVGATVVVVVLFTVVAGCSVAVPVLAYAVAAERMRKPLDRLRGWLVDNNASVMAVLLLVIGVTLAGEGIGGL